MKVISAVNGSGAYDVRRAAVKKAEGDSSEAVKNAVEEESGKNGGRISAEEEPAGPGSMMGSAAGGSGSGGKVKASASEDSVGQLASQLARAETDLAVREIQGKVMRALVNLKMAAGLSEGKDKEKITAQIRRMEKLQKKIIKKLKQLSEEADLERERERAVEKQEEEKAREAERELKSGRKKRRRDEREYARRENMEDSRSSDPMSAVSGAGGGSSETAVDPAAVFSGGFDAVSMPAEGVFVDVSV